MNKSSVFYSIAEENNLSQSQLHEIVEAAFDKMILNYAHFVLEFDEDGVSIKNFDACSEEETGGWPKDVVEASLTDELIKAANRIVLLREEKIRSYEKLALVGQAADAIVTAARANDMTVEELMPFLESLAAKRFNK